MKTIQGKALGASKFLHAVCVHNTNFIVCDFSVTI